MIIEQRPNDDADLISYVNLSLNGNQAEKEVDYI